MLLLTPAMKELEPAASRLCKADSPRAANSERGMLDVDAGVAQAHGEKRCHEDICSMQVYDLSSFLNNQTSLHNLSDDAMSTICLEPVLAAHRLRMRVSGFEADVGAALVTALLQ